MPHSSKEPPDGEGAAAKPLLVLNKRVGKGSYAQVYSGTLGSPAAPVAIKVLRDDVGPQGQVPDEAALLQDEQDRESPTQGAAQQGTGDAAIEAAVLREGAQGEGAAAAAAADAQLALKMFLREALIMAKLSHRALLKCHAIQKLPPDHPGLLTEKGGKGTAPRWCMALDLCTGGSLRGVVAQQMQQGGSRSYSLRDMLSWLHDIAEAVAYLHQNNVIHRDLKLDNCLLRSPHKKDACVPVLVADLGLHVRLVSNSRRNRALLRKSVGGALSQGGASSQGTIAAHIQQHRAGAHTPPHAAGSRTDSLTSQGAAGPRSTSLAGVAASGLASNGANTLAASGALTPVSRSALSAAAAAGAAGPPSTFLTTKEAQKEGLVVPDEPLRARSVAGSVRDGLPSGLCSSDATGADGEEGSLAGGGGRPLGRAEAVLMAVLAAANGQQQGAAAAGEDKVTPLLPGTDTGVSLAAWAWGASGGEEKQRTPLQALHEDVSVHVGMHGTPLLTVAHALNLAAPPPPPPASGPASQAASATTSDGPRSSSGDHPAVPPLSLPLRTSSGSIATAAADGHHHHHHHQAHSPSFHRRIQPLLVDAAPATPPARASSPGSATPHGGGGSPRSPLSPGAIVVGPFASSGLDTPASTASTPAAAEQAPVQLRAHSASPSPSPPPAALTQQLSAGSAHGQPSLTPRLPCRLGSTSLAHTASGGVPRAATPPPPLPSGGGGVVAGVGAAAQGPASAGANGGPWAFLSAGSPARLGLPNQPQGEGYSTDGTAPAGSGPAGCGAGDASEGLTVVRGAHSVTAIGGRRLGLPPPVPGPASARGASATALEKGLRPPPRRQLSSSELNAGGRTALGSAVAMLGAAGASSPGPGTPSAEAPRSSGGSFTGGGSARPSQVRPSLQLQSTHNRYRRTSAATGGGGDASPLPSARLPESLAAATQSVRFSFANLTIPNNNSGNGAVPRAASFFGGERAASMAGASVGRMSLARLSYAASMAGTDWGEVLDRANLINEAEGLGGGASVGAGGGGAGGVQLKGLARHVMSQLSPEELAWVYSLTGGTGSALYMAPEVHLHEPYNEKIDVFSFGVMAYELLAQGLLVYSHLSTATLPGVHTPEEYAARVAEGYRPNKPKCKGSVEEQLWEIIGRCWDQDPNARPAMQDVALLLEVLSAEAATLEASDKKPRGGRRGSLEVFGRGSFIDLGGGGGAGGKAAGAQGADAGAAAPGCSCSVM